jgi:hypothetical protein
MDRAQIDALTRSLIFGISRRKVFATTAGGFMAGMPYALGDDVEAKKKKGKQKKKRKKQKNEQAQKQACTPGSTVAQLSVPYTGAPVLTPVLAQGQVYTVQVSGAAPTNAVHSVDAEYDFITATPNDLTKVTDVAVVDIGLSIDDPTTDATKTPKWGPYNPAHVYSQQIIGQGRPATLLMQDSVYTDNSGAVSVTITCG